jgi:hypothetical protein
VTSTGCHLGPHLLGNSTMLLDTAVSRNQVPAACCCCTVGAHIYHRNVMAQAQHVSGPVLCHVPQSSVVHTQHACTQLCVASGCSCAPFSECVVFFQIATQSLVCDCSPYATTHTNSCYLVCHRSWALAWSSGSACMQAPAMHLCTMQHRTHARDSMLWLGFYRHDTAWLL